MSDDLVAKWARGARPEVEEPDAKPDDSEQVDEENEARIRRVMGLKPAE